MRIFRALDEGQKTDCNCRTDGRGQNRARHSTGPAAGNRNYFSRFEASFQGVGNWNHQTLTGWVGPWSSTIPAENQSGSSARRKNSIAPLGLSKLASTWIALSCTTGSISE